MSANKDLEMVAFACPKQLKDTVKDIASTRGQCSESSVYRDCLTIGAKQLLQEIRERQPGQLSLVNG